MSNRTRRTGGGFFQIANRWIDAGFMKKAPGSVTQVYMHLCRWSDNNSDEAAQPMKLIARQCGLSEDVTRKAVRILEAWGVIIREETPRKDGVNIWILAELPKVAPEYPGGTNEGVVKSRGPQQSGGGEKSDPHKVLPLNQTNSNQTEREPERKTVSSETDGEAVSASDFVNANQPDEPDLGGDPELTPFALASAVMAEVGVDLARLPASAKGKQLAVAKRLISDDMDIAEGVAIARWLLRDNFWRDKGIDLFVVESNRMKYIAATAARNMPKSATNTGDPFEEIRVGGMRIQRGVVEQAKRKFDWYSAAVDAGFMGVTQEHVKAMQSGGKLVEVFPRDIAVQINRKLIHHIRQFDAVSRV